MADRPQAPSPNAIAGLNGSGSGARVPGGSGRAPSGLEPAQGYHFAPGPAPRLSDVGRFGNNVAVLISFLVHALGLIILFMSALLSPKRPSVVPVFELVSLEKPKLRPLTPKAPRPPEPPPPEPVKPPDAPRLTPKTNAVATKKPEPKVVKEPDPDPAPVKDAPQEQQQLQPQIVAHVPSDPRLSLWAGRVKKKAETLWNPPTGIDILGAVKTVVSFTVTRDGTVQEAQVAASSGNADLDELALRTIQRMERVPPIPENFPEEQLQVSYEFIYGAQ